MSRHRLWEADEVLERITAEFDEGIADIDELLAQSEAALADFDRLVSA